MSLNTDNNPAARNFVQAEQPGETWAGAMDVVTGGLDTVGRLWIHFLASDPILCFRHWSEQVGEWHVVGEDVCTRELEMTVTYNGIAVCMHVPLIQIQPGEDSVVVFVSSEHGYAGSVRIDDERVVTLLERAMKIADGFGLQDDPNWRVPLRLVPGTALRELLASGVLCKADLQPAE
jgi:hypothetical protein